MTADNAELHVWPIDLEQEYVTKSTGYIVVSNIGGYKISDSRTGQFSPPELVERLVLSMPDPGELRSPRSLCGVDWYLPDSSRVAYAPNGNKKSTAVIDRFGIC